MARQDDIECSHIVERVDARAIDQDRVIDIAASVERLGLINRIVVRPRTITRPGYRGPGYEVIAGRHRLRAFIRLGREAIPCDVIEADEVAAELVMIAENLHRSDLTALQRSEQVSRWIVMTGTKQEAEGVSRRPDAKLGRPEGGVRAAARELGISEPDARRSVKINSLSAEAKAVAVEVGLADNQSALLSAAKEPTRELQVAALRAKTEKPEITCVSFDSSAPSPPCATVRDDQAYWDMIADMSGAERDAHIAAIPRPSRLDTALAAYDSLSPTDRSAFHKIRPAPSVTDNDDLPSSLMLKPSA